MDIELFLLFVTVLVLELCMAEEECAPNGKTETFTCLKQFFNDTEQRLPPHLTDLLGDPRARVRTRSRRDQQYRRQSEATSAWCGSFETYMSCVADVDRRCADDEYWTCVILSTFSKKYGPAVCELDLRPWLAADGKECKDLVNPATSASTRPVPAPYALVLAALLASAVHHSSLLLNVPLRSLCLSMWGPCLSLWRPCL